MRLGFDPTKYGIEDCAAKFKANTEPQRAELQRKIDDALLQKGLNGQAYATNPVQGAVELDVQPKEEKEDTGVQQPAAEGAGAAPKTEDQRPTERYFVSKDAKKAKEAEIQEAFMQYGTATGETVDEKTAKKLAKKYVENMERRENAEFTQTYVDKDAYKAAEKDRKQQEKDLVAQYRAEGMSKKEAKQKAKAQLPTNEYVKNKKTREFIEAHKDEFYDENGVFSSDKAKRFAIDCANQNTKEGEAENYYLSLKERRRAAETYHVKDDVIADVAHRTGVGYENDYTELIQAGVIVGSTALAYGAGQLFRVGTKSASAASSAADAVAGVAASAGSGAGAAAAAEASVSGSLLTTPLGILVGEEVARRIKDPGGNDKPAIEPGKPKEEVKEPQDDDPKDDEPIEDPKDDEPIEDKPCPVMEWEAGTCDHTVKKGDNWTSVALGKVQTINGKKPSGKVLKAYVHALKLKHGVTDFSLNTMPKVGETMVLYDDFGDLLADEELVKKHPELLLLKDADIQLDCDGIVKQGKTVKNPKVRYNPFTGAPTAPAKYKQSCDDVHPILVK